MTKRGPTSRGGSRAARPYVMDPDRFQMKDLKRRVKSLEDTLERVHDRIRGLMALALEAHVCRCGNIKRE